MFGIKKIKQRIEMLENVRPVSLELFNEMRKHIKLIFRGFNDLPTTYYSNYKLSNTFVIEQLILLVLQQQKDIEELKKK